MKHVYALLTLCLLAFSAVAQLPFGETEFLPGEMLAQVTDNSKVNQIVQDLSVAYGKPTGVAPLAMLSEHMRMWHFSFDASAVNAFDMKRAFANHPDIVLVQFNHTVKQRETTPNDPQLNEQWHHVNANDADIDSDLAWDITTGGTTAFGDEIVVCVIEGGNLNHPDLVDNKWVNTQEIPGNGIDDDGNGYIDDYNGWNVQSNNDAGVFTGNHGTQVMGMIGAKGNNNLGVSGINWDVKMMSVAGENLGSEASVVSAYNYPLTMRMLYNNSGGESGAFVVATNASWGIDNADASNYPIWCAVYDTLGEEGILSCGATANNNVNIDVVGDMPTGCASPYMVAVTASNNNDVRTFSGYGINTIDLAAPGANVFTTSGSNNYGSTSGTSFASPLTAGAIALIYSTPCPSFMALVSADPQAGADYVYQVLMEGTDPIPNLANEVISGGRLNANNSIQLILQGCSDSDCLAPFGVNASGDGEGNYTIAWNATAAMLSFNLRYREVGSEVWIEVNGLDVTSYTLPELEWCSAIEAQVSASCDDSDSSWSNLVSWVTEGCCEYPNSDSYVLSNVGENSATFSWSSVLAAQSYTLILTPSGGSPLQINGVTGTTYTFTDLDACTMYDVSLGVVCVVGGLDPEFAGSFTTFGCGPCADLPYCSSFGGTDDEWIDRVVLSSLDNNSGNNGGYGDYTMDLSLTATLDPGGTYAFTLTPGFGGFAFTELFRIWIDLNQNGSFDDNEILYTSEGVTAAVSGTLNVPVTAEPGSARLRVSMKYAGFFGGDEAPTSCEEMEFGEVEDYCVEITDNIIGITEQGTVAWNLYPNPANNMVYITLPLGVHRLEVFDLTGRMVEQTTTQGNLELSFADQPEGVYLVRLTTDGGSQSTRRVIIAR